MPNAKTTNNNTSLETYPIDFLDDGCSDETISHDDYPIDFLNDGFYAF